MLKKHLIIPDRTCMQASFVFIPHASFVSIVSILIVNYPTRSKLKKSTMKLSSSVLSSTRNFRFERTEKLTIGIIF